MARRSAVFALSALSVTIWFTGCASGTASREAVPPPPPTPAEAKSGPGVAQPPPPPPPPPVAKLDSTGVDARPSVLVEGIDFAGVRTRLIPHVMGRGWALTVNKSDSIEFQRPANSGFSLELFGLASPPGARILIRFRLKADSGGTRIEATSRLIGRSGVLPYKASAAVLEASLEDLRQDLKSAPTSKGDEVDRVKSN